MHLKRLTQTLMWATLGESFATPIEKSLGSPRFYLALLRVGFSIAVERYRQRGVLLPHHFILTVSCGQRYTFCCTFRRLTPPRCYLALCPMEPGLSSQFSLSDCLASSRNYYTDLMQLTHYLKIKIILSFLQL